MPVTLASYRVLAAGLRSSDADDAVDLRVREQRPAPGDSVRLGTRVRLETDAEETADQMPDLRGLTVREATWWLTALGVKPTIEGSGVVRSQSPAPGSPIGPRAVLRFR